jgi:hypothetical protein
MVAEASCTLYSVYQPSHIHHIFGSNNLSLCEKSTTIVLHTIPSAQ